VRKSGEKLRFPRADYDAENDVLVVEIGSSPTARTLQFEDWLTETRDADTCDVLSIRIDGLLAFLAGVQLERTLCGTRQGVYAPIYAMLADALAAEHQRDGLRRLTRIMREYGKTPERERLPLARSMVKFLKGMMEPKAAKKRKR